VAPHAPRPVINQIELFKKILLAFPELFQYPQYTNLSSQLVLAQHSRPCVTWLHLLYKQHSLFHPSEPANFMPVFIESHLDYAFDA
jgi:hypothetical protein